MHLKHRGKICDLCPVVTVDVCPSFLRCEQDIIRFDVTVSYQCLLVKVLQPVGHLLKDEHSHFLVHRGTEATKIFELLLLREFLAQVLYHALVRLILHRFFINVGYLTHVCEL